LRDELKFSLVVCCCLIADKDWQKIGVWYQHYRWSDSTREIPANLEDATYNVIYDIEQHNERVMIYCDSGRNRSALLAANVVKRLLHVSGQKAIEIVRAGRPMALKNQFFINHLRTAP